MAEEAEALGRPSAEQMAYWLALGGKPGPMETPEGWLMEAEERARLHATVGQLKARFRAVVVRRFGLEDGREQTLRELGMSEEVCTARVGQMLRVSFRKLKFWLSRPRDEEVALARSLTPGLWKRAAGQPRAALGGRMTHGRRRLDAPTGRQAAVRISGNREGAAGAERSSAALTVRSR